MWAMYQRLLDGIDWLQLPVAQTAYAKNIYWVFAMVIRNRAKIDAEQAMKRMAEFKIGTRPFFVGMHEQPVFRNMGLFHNEFYKVSENMSKNGFYVPSGLAITEEQIHQVAQHVKEIL